MSRRNGWRTRGALRRGFSSLFYRPGQRRLTRWAMAAVFVSGVVAVGLLSLAPWGCSHTMPTTAFALPESRTIRVRLVANVDQVSFTATAAPIYWTSANNNERYLNLPVNSPMPISVTAQGWKCGNANLGQGELYLRPATIGSLAVNDTAYRGQYRLVPVGGNRFDVVNDVDVDDYLKGVVARELYADWHPNAYRAQAIIARTYALYEKHAPREARPHWDVHPDQRSQVYGGIPAESAKSVQAVEATRGIVVVYGPSGDEHIFKAFFSSCCGGIAQNVTDAFPNEPFAPPLAGQRVGTVCSISNRFNWGPVILTKQELTQRIRKWNASRGRGDIALVQSVVIEQRNSLGRPTKYAVTDVRGGRYVYNCEDFRSAASYGGSSDNNSILYSSYIENVFNEPDRVRFVGGHGYGHGVGMCQWCTEARARSGVGFEDLVLYAFPGAKLAHAY